MERIDTTRHVLENPFRAGDLLTIPHNTILKTADGMFVAEGDLSVEITSSHPGEYVFFDQARQGFMAYVDEDGVIIFVPVSQKLLDANDKPVTVALNRKAGSISYG